MKFSLIMPPQVVFGCGSVSQLPAMLTDLKSQKPLVVTSKGMPKRDFVKNLLSLIELAHIAYQIYDQVKPEPAISNVEDCFRFAEGNGCDLIIGLGGGSVMDVAKKVATDLEVSKIMLPTTAGTGSEVTHESVFKVDGKKRAFVDKKLIPDIAVVDPELTFSMPSKLVAATGMDALAHAIECYDSKGANPLVRALASQAYEIIKNNLGKAVQGNREARINMSLGSLMAGMAFGNSGTALGHALSYPLSNRGVAHGEAVAMVLPCAMEFNGVEASFVSEIKKVVELIQPKCNPKWDINNMAREVMADEKHLANNPRQVTYEDVVELFKQMRNSLGVP